MANTYSQIYIQTVFAVKHREALIQKEWRDDLHRYMTGILKEKGQKSLAIGGIHDHVHIFFGYHNLTMTLPNLVQEMKKSTNVWVNENKLSLHHFDWQAGYGAFSYSRSQVDAVCKYVLNQEEHHKKRTFQEEYFDLLEKFDIAYDKKYVFEFF